MDKVTLKEIQQRLGISRTTFNERYKPFVVQLPSLTPVNIYDWASVKEWHEKRPRRKVGRKPKKQTQENV